LVQIFFAHRRQLEAVKRFVSGFLLVIDGTFNTNDHRLPLLTMVGVLNTGETFPVAFSFCQSESRAAFDFVWESLREECFTPEIPPPRVILGDWAAGLIASIPQSFPECQFQGCDWHAVQAMIRKFRSEGYTKDEVEGYKNENGEWVEGLQALAWKYVKSISQEELRLNRQQFINILKPKDRNYISEHWQHLEPYFIWLYTKRYPNLGSTSSQRAESYHVVMREITNSQLTLEEATKRLVSRVLSILRDLEISEDRSLRTYPRLLQVDNEAMKNLKCKITLYAARMIETEWPSTYRVRD
jgi:hypothetical protein